MESILVAETIPFASAKEKYERTQIELAKGRDIEIWDNEKVIYSQVKEKKKENKNRRNNK